jgi:hypothetical protein
MAKSSRALKSPRQVKYPRPWKNPVEEKLAGLEKPAGLEKQAAAYCLGSAESPAADSFLVWLMSSRSAPRRCDDSRMQSPSKDKAQAALLLWANSLPYCTGCLYRPAMPRNGRNSGGNQKFGGRLKFHYFLSDHKNSNSASKCPITAENLYMITIAVQYQLPHSRPSD